MIVNIECNVGDTLIILVAVIDVVGLTVIYEYIQNIKNTIFILVVIVEYDYTAFIKYLFAYSTCCVVSICFLLMDCIMALLMSSMLSRPSA